MAVEETPNGYRAPDGNEPFRNGDNVIAHNAWKNEEHVASLNSSLAALQGRMGQAEANISAGMGGGPGLAEDPLNPGTYFMADDSPIHEDPDAPGLYTF